ncbi:MAG: heme-dependent oxidative N-demethylase subunit alpha family protein [Pseudomonadota bacterium]
MSDSVLQQHVPYPATEARRLPGMQILAPRDWLVFDEAEAAQCALLRRLLGERRAEVVAAMPGTEALTSEACAVISEHLARDHGRPGVARFEDLAGGVQEDVILLEKRDGAHVMVAALLCFPASWTLAEKIGRPMARIHAPVAAIDARMDAMIEAVFAAVTHARPLWRYNQLWYRDPALFQPRREGDPRGHEVGDYLRTERQCLVRMPSGALLFTIHTYVVHRDDL